MYWATAATVNPTMLLSKCIVRNKLVHRAGLKNVCKRALVVDINEHWTESGTQVHLLDEAPSQMIELTKENGLQFYKDMNLIRQAEIACAELYRKKLVRGFCHLYIGQEAVAVGISSVLIPEDTVITSYRCHGWLIVRTHDLVGFFAELLGNSLGLSKGKGGSMHMYSKNFYGGNGIVGAHVALGTGIALKHKYTDSKAISVTVFGDGAFSQGQVFESFNIAKLLNLPVLFVVENNIYGMGTSSDRSAANNKYYKGCTFIPGIRANGMDILSVIEASKFAAKHIRDGKGPIILEMMTYRYRGHSMSDPGTTYRDRSEIQKVRDERDCVRHLAKLLKESNLATEEELEAIRAEMKKKVQEELAAAKKGKLPPLGELTTECYTEYTGKIRLTKLLEEVPYKSVAKHNKMKN